MPNFEPSLIKKRKHSVPLCIVYEPKHVLTHVAEPTDLVINQATHWYIAPTQTCGERRLASQGHYIRYPPEH